MKKINARTSKSPIPGDRALVDCSEWHFLQAGKRFQNSGLPTLLLLEHRYSIEPTRAKRPHGWENKVILRCSVSVPLTNSDSVPVLQALLNGEIKTRALLNREIKTRALLNREIKTRAWLDGEIET